MSTAKAPAAPSGRICEKVPRPSTHEKKSNAHLYCYHGCIQCESQFKDYRTLADLGHVACKSNTLSSISSLQKLHTLFTSRTSGCLKCK